MQHPIPHNPLLTSLAAALAAITIIGCEPFETVQQTPVPDVATTPAPQIPEKPHSARPLNLSLAKLASEFVQTQASTAGPGRQFINPARKKPDRVEFNGIVLTNASVEDYVESIDGAVFSMTIRSR